MSPFPHHSPLRRLLVHGSLAALLLAVVACENGTGPSSRELARIQLSDSVFVLNDGATAQVSVTLLDQEGATMEQLPAGTVLRWTSLDTSIVTVQAGLVTTQRPGQTEIVAEAGAVRASAGVRVEAVPPTFAPVAGDEQAAGKGEPLDKRLEVRVLDVHGRPLRDAEVEFAVTAGGGSLSPALQRTDSAGLASAAWTLGPALGEQKAEARLTGQIAAALRFTARAMRQIAFVSERDGNAEIYLMNEDGSGQRNLTKHPAADEFPRWSPDGKKITFVSERAGTSAPYSMNADGSELTRLPSPPGPPVSEPSFRWSPDGTKGVFERAVDGYSHIYIINADGSGLRDLTNVDRILYDHDGQPAWSPDGSRVAFIRQRMSSIAPGFYWIDQLLVINVDGSGLRVVRSIEGQTAMRSPGWSPDAKSIAYSSQWRASTPRVEIVDADGTNLRSIPSDRSRVGSWGVSWSPDGRMVAYTLVDGWGQFGGFFPEYLALADAATGNPLVLGSIDPSPCPGYPDQNNECVKRDQSVRWTADGTTIAFVRMVSGSRVPSTSEIHVVTIGRSSGRSRVSASPARDYSPDWRP